MTLELVGGARVVFTGRHEGDMGHGGVYVHHVADDVAARRRAVVDMPWTWVRQVASATVVRVTEPGGGAGSTADALVTDQPGCALAVLTADCAPVVLSSPDGVVGVAHAGWAGLEAGVLERTVEAMDHLGATAVEAVVGPCIRAECYEFGAEDLDRVARRVGPEVRATTATGRPALDLVAGARAALSRVGVSRVDDRAACTACGSGWFSWRGRGELHRQAAVVWR